MLISKTPVRISFFGGGTDYPDYYLRTKGAVLGTTINKFVYLSINKQGPFFDYKTKISYSSSELVNEVDEIKHPSVRECLKYLNLHFGLDIHVFSDLPNKTGLGSSSSFTVGLLNALHKMQKEVVSKKRLADEALYVEQQLIKERVGSQDQLHAAFGGLNLIEFTKNGYVVNPINLPTEKETLLDKSLLLFYTGINRYANEILKEQIENTKAKTKDSLLEKMLGLVYKAKDVLIHSNENLFLDELGELLKESWNLKKQLSSKISNSHIDEYYFKALQAGALGGKLCGAGHGGFLLFLVSQKDQNNVREALKDLTEVNFSFEKQGTQIIYQQ